MKVTIYTKTICPYCTAAKNWLKSKGYTYEEINLDNDSDRQKFYESVGNGVRTVPQIYVDGERIGGYQELTTSRLATSFTEEF
jgi:glutaredoxin-related protein